MLPKLPEKERGKHSWVYCVVVGPSWWVVLRYPVKTCRSNEETSEEGRPTTAAWVDPEKEMIMLLSSLTPWHTPRRGEGRVLLSLWRPMADPRHPPLSSACCSGPQLLNISSSTPLLLFLRLSPSQGERGCLPGGESWIRSQVGWSVI